MPVATGPGGGTLVYEGNLKRVKQTLGGKTIYSVYAKSGELIHRDNVTDAKKTDYINLAGASVRLVNGTNPVCTHKDHLGSPIAASDASGTVMWREIYRPFGEKWNDNPSQNNEESFTGHIDDSDLKLTYMQARYYDHREVFIERPGRVRG